LTAACSAGSGCRDRSLADNSTLGQQACGPQLRRPDIRRLAMMGNTNLRLIDRVRRKWARLTEFAQFALLRASEKVGVEAEELPKRRAS
jgi:hypothetical protein